MKTADALMVVYYVVLSAACCCWRSAISPAGATPRGGNNGANLHPRQRCPNRGSASSRVRYH